MKQALAFITSKKGKIVIGIIIAIIIAYVIWMQYQKSIYGGYTLRGLAVYLANQYSIEKVNSIKNSDPNYARNLGKQEALLDIIRWYDDNANFSNEFSDDWIKTKLTDLGIDFIKNPKALQLRSDIVSNINIMNAYTGKN